MNPATLDDSSGAPLAAGAPSGAANDPGLGREILPTLARWTLGAVFVYMGMHKVMDPDTFLKLVRQYDFISNPIILNVIAAALPWFEVFCGALLLAGVAVRGAALVVLAMLLPFTAIIIRRALFIATSQHLTLCQVQFDCGCGGGEVPICPKLLENAGLALISIWLLTGRGKKFALRFSLLVAG